jgi:TonB family protein
MTPQSSHCLRAVSRRAISISWAHRLRPEEACDTRNQPEVAFQLTESGEVKNVVLTRSSGDSSVDRKVLQMVRNSHYPVTNCGACAIFARVPVSLKCR